MQTEATAPGAPPWIRAVSVPINHQPGQVADRPPGLAGPATDRQASIPDVNAVRMDGLTGSPVQYLTPTMLRRPGL